MHNALGILLKKERKDFDGAEAVYRAATAADLGHANAHYNLGVLLKKVRQDIEGAEAAYRAAIAADPGYAKAQYNLGRMLQKKRGSSTALKRPTARRSRRIRESRPRHATKIICCGTSGTTSTARRRHTAR